MSNVPDWLARRASLSPSKVALVDTQKGDSQITYAQWNEAANRTAHFFSQRLDIRKLDRVAVLAKNSVEYLDIWFAAQKLGAVMQTLNWRLTPYELARLVRDAEPVVLVYDGDEEEFGDQVRELRWRLEESSSPLPTFVSLGEPFSAGDLPLSLRERFPADPPPSPYLDPEDAWVIVYTGGTTGMPKGAVLSYRAVAANAVNTIISWGLSPNDVTILSSPLFHTGGLNVFTAPLVYLGGTTIVTREFNLEQTFNLLEHGGATVWFGVPTMFVMMQAYLRWEKADFSKLRIMISGGAPCPMPVFERFWEKGVDFKTGYGLTEAGPNTFWLPPEQVRDKPGSVGYPLFHVSVKIVNERGEELPPGSVGELLIRGPHVFSGYWVEPGVTDHHALSDGWLHTGDLAMRDEDGAYYIMGRLKDMIISGGENVYPAELESVIHAHPGVAEVAVIRAPDEKWGEVGWAVVASKPGIELDENSLIEFCRQRLARYKIPKRFIMVGSLPTTGAGKVDKKLLEEMYVEGEE